VTQDGIRRTNKNYGDSPGRRDSVPIASSLFESCWRVRRSQLAKRLASSTRGTASRLPFGSDSGVLASPAKRCPATQPHAVPRVDDASRPNCAAHIGMREKR
jgi:hypothetical protein